MTSEEARGNVDVQAVIRARDEAQAAIAAARTERDQWQLESVMLLKERNAARADVEALRAALDGAQAFAVADADHEIKQLKAEVAALTAQRDEAVKLLGDCNAETWVVRGYGFEAGEWRKRRDAFLARLSSALPADIAWSTGLADVASRRKDILARLSSAGAQQVREEGAAPQGPAKASTDVAASEPVAGGASKSRPAIAPLPHRDSTDAPAPTWYATQTNKRYATGEEAVMASLEDLKRREALKANIREAIAPAPIQAATFIVGKHPECARCGSLVLPNGICVNGCAGQAATVGEAEMQRLCECGPEFVPVCPAEGTNGPVLCRRRNPAPAPRQSAEPPAADEPAEIHSEGTHYCTERGCPMRCGRLLWHDASRCLCTYHYHRVPPSSPTPSVADPPQCPEKVLYFYRRGPNDPPGNQMGQCERPYGHEGPHGRQQDQAPSVAVGMSESTYPAEALHAAHRNGMWEAWTRAEKMLRERAQVSGGVAKHVREADADLIGSWLRGWENVATKSEREARTTETGKL